MTSTQCASCGEPAAGCSLPVDDDGEIVANSHTGETGGVPSCRACFELHAAGGDNGPAVLVAYFRTNEATLAKLESAREAIAAITDLARKACRENEVDR